MSEITCVKLEYTQVRTAAYGYDVQKRFIEYKVSSKHVRWAGLIFAHFRAKRH